MKYVYTKRDRLDGCYSIPVFAPETPKDMERAHVSFILHNPDKAFEQHLNECELCYMGKFHEDLGTFELLDKPEILVDLGPICEQAKRRYENVN